MHQVVEFTPEAWFKPFGDAVSNVRRAGAIIAETMKLVRFCLEHCSDAKASRNVNTPLFRKL